MGKTYTDDEPKEDVTVTTSSMIDNTCVEVIGRGPYRSHRLITVHFSRRGEITHGYRHEPTFMERYLEFDAIPDNVVAAARKLYASKR